MKIKKAYHRASSALVDAYPFINLVTIITDHNNSYREVYDTDIPLRLQLGRIKQVELFEQLVLSTILNYLIMAKHKSPLDYTVTTNDPHKTTPSVFSLGNNFLEKT